LLLAQIAGRVETINKPLKSIQTSLWLWPKIEHIFGLSLSLSFLSIARSYSTLISPSALLLGGMGASDSGIIPNFSVILALKHSGVLSCSFNKASMGFSP